MTTTPKGTRASYFADEAAAPALGKSVVAFLAKIQRGIVAKHLSPENTHRLRHGGTWAHPGLPNTSDGKFETHASIAEISFEDIVKHDLSVIDRFAQKLAQDMERQFAQLMYSTVSAAADQVGNTVDAKAAGSTREAFAEMLEKIEFASDKFGNVRLPEIHAGPEAAAKLRKSLDDAPPAFQRRIEEIKA
jgi:hypothetical protein